MLKRISDVVSILGIFFIVLAIAGRIHGGVLNLIVIKTSAISALSMGTALMVMGVCLKVWDW